MIFRLFIFAVLLVLWSASASAELQNTLSLTLPALTPGTEGSFTASNLTGPAASADGLAGFTFSGLHRFDLSTGSGRFATLPGTRRYGLSVGPFLLFQSFLTPNFLTVTSSSTSCSVPSEVYNWVLIRARSPDSLRNAMAADSDTYYAGGTFSYDGASFSASGNGHFTLNGPSVPVGSQLILPFSPCSNGAMKVQTTGAPFELLGTLYLSNRYLLGIASGGNPTVWMAVVRETLSAATMAGFASSRLPGILTTFDTEFGPTDLRQRRQNLILTPDAAGTLFTIQQTSDEDPTVAASIGTVQCGTLNSPMTGFCSGTIALDGNPQAGKLVCAVSTFPDKVLVCSGQRPDRPSVGLSLIARVQNTSVLGIQLANRVISNGSGPTVNLVDFTATLVNLSGKPVSTMALPTAAAEQLQAPFSAPGAFGGGNRCGTSLAGYSSCLINLRFNPATAGTFLQTFRVAYDKDGDGTRETNATATLIGASLLSSLELDASSGSFTPEAGGSKQFQATARYSDNSTQNVNSAVLWGSSNPAVGSVSPTGAASFASRGATTVSASLGAVEAFADSTVPMTAEILVASPHRVSSEVSSQLSLDFGSVSSGAGDTALVPLLY